MLMFILINTASIQLIPTNVIKIIDNIIKEMNINLLSSKLIFSPLLKKLLGRNISIPTKTKVGISRALNRAFLLSIIDNIPLKFMLVALIFSNTLLKIYFMTQADVKPPKFIIFVNVNFANNGIEN